MFTHDDLDNMKNAVSELQELVVSNNKDADYLLENNIGIEYVYELRENAIEAKKILDRYINLIDHLKIDAVNNFKKL